MSEARIMRASACVHQNNQIITKFIIIIALAEIPVTFALNSIGSSLKDFSKEPNLSLQSLITDINFYVPFLIVTVLFFFINKIKKNR